MRENFWKVKHVTVKLNPSECKWYLISIYVLDFKLNQERLHPSASKVVVAPWLNNVSILKSFIELINYYHESLYMSADFLEVWCAFSRKNIVWNWSEHCEKAF